MGRSRCSTTTTTLGTLVGTSEHIWYSNPVRARERARRPASNGQHGRHFVRHTYLVTGRIWSPEVDFGTELPVDLERPGYLGAILDPP